MMNVRTYGVLGVLCGVAGWSSAQTQDAPGQSLDQQADDPTASLMSLQLANWYTAGFHGLDDQSSNTAVVRAVVPFEAFGQNHIFRATVPVITDSPVADTGLGDMTLFDLVVFDQNWGRWGLGPVALLPTGGRDRGAEKFALGPAVGFTIQDGPVLWGAFNQNLFSVAGDEDRDDVQVSILQPIFTYSLGDGWSTGASEMTFTYEWNEGRWSSLPLGVKLAKLVHFHDTPVQMNLQYEHDFADDAVGPEDTLRFTLKFLFPR